MTHLTTGMKYETSSTPMADVHWTACATLPAPQGPHWILCKGLGFRVYRVHSLLRARAVRV